MKSRTLVLMLVALTAAVAGYTTARSGAEVEQERTYRVMLEFKMGGTQTFEGAVASATEWTQAFKTFGYDARLFMHEWGPSNSFYIFIETTDWNAISTIFDEVGNEMPELLSQPFGWAGHSDIIMRELPVE